MNLKKVIILILSLSFYNCFAQQSEALSLSEIIANNARFKPYNKTNIETLASIDQHKLIDELNNDNSKNAFWLNIFNSFMLLNLRDTANAGDYKRFYKSKNIEIAGRKFSLYNIEHEFLRCGVKNKSLGFKKSEFGKKDSLWKKLRPTKTDFKVVFCIYRGMYGFPPFQIIENADVKRAFDDFFSQYIQNFSDGKNLLMYDWVMKYKKDLKEKPIEEIFAGHIITYIKTPNAVYIDNFLPKYEKVKFKEEEINPWLK